MWSHFDHCGPRTTNLAEGFHNSLNSRFGMPHPSMATFLDWLQKCQFETQCREMQLAAGRPPKQRATSYVRNDENIAASYDTVLILDACLPIHFRALTVGRHLMVSQLRILDMSVILLVSEPGFRLRISI